MVMGSLQLFNKEGVEISKENALRSLLTDFIETQCYKFDYDYFDIEILKDGSVSVTLYRSVNDGYDGQYLEETKNIIL